MRPSASTQVRAGIAVAVVTLVVIAVLAFVPDPLMRRKVYVTAFDNVDLVKRGAPVYFRGAAVGDVRSVELEPGRGVFAVRLAVRRDLAPGPCAFAQIVAPLPVTAPRVELVKLDAPAALCAEARAQAGCRALAAPAEGGVPLTGCRREADMLAGAAAAMVQVTELTQAANRMAGQLQAILDGPGAPGEAQAAKQLMADAGAALAAANRATRRLDASLAPGGDAAVSMANLRKASGKAAEIDVDQLNATVAEARDLLVRNQQSIDTLLGEGAALSHETRALLQGVSGSLASTSASLQRASDNLDALTERVGDDPTFVVRGQRYSDPPPPGAAP